MSVSPQTAHQLIEDVHLLGRVMRGSLDIPEEGRLHPGGLGVLVALAARGHCRQNELAADLCISQSALSRHITDMVGAGYTVRQPDPGDGRATQVRVTDDGLALLMRTRTTMATALQEVLADWSDADARSAQHMIHKLTESLTRRAHQAVQPDNTSNRKESQEIHV
jgi:DNA-binding MarR family transcriptional regulator